MPIVNGLSAAAQIKQIYIDAQTDISGSTLIRPLIVFLSQHNFEEMKSLTYESEQCDLFFPKPLSSR